MILYSNIFFVQKLISSQENFFLNISIKKKLKKRQYTLTINTLTFTACLKAKAKQR